MKRKEYSFVEISLRLLEEKDVITYSAPTLDSEKENDVVGDDIFD